MRRERQGRCSPISRAFASTLQTEVLRAPPCSELQRHAQLRSNVENKDETKHLTPVRMALLTFFLPVDAFHTKAVRPKDMWQTDFTTSGSSAGA
jgi:hypothetical protein